MRSILALVLALLVLAAEVPGLFIESPVCAAVDGVNAVARAKRRPAGPSCCGTDACPMKAKGCGKSAECSMEAAYGPDPIIASVDRGAASERRICSPSCDREGVRMIPGVPDPGTLDAPRTPPAQFAVADRCVSAPANHPTRNPVPADPPPRY